MQRLTGLVKTLAKSFRLDFSEPGPIRDFYEVPLPQRPFSDMGYEIRKHLENIAVLIIGQSVQDLIAVKLVANRRSAC